MMKKTGLIVLTVIMLACSSTAAFASEEKGGGNWDFSLAPLYLWMVDMEGDLGIGPIDSELQVDFGDIFDNLEAVFTFHFEALHRSNIGFFLDYSYIDISASETQGPLKINVDFTSTLVEAGGLYRFGTGPHAIDLLGGIRYTKLEPDVNVTPGPNGSLTEDWIDPIIGVRYFYDFGNKWMFSARGDIGGFGAGCDFTWNVSALVHFQPWKNVAIVGGYRALGQDYEDGSGAGRFKYDMRLAGPIVGFNILC